jgi:diguanylate cyclase (GGDEF)-like protein/PAS domain S-box-containing protein
VRRKPGTGTVRPTGRDADALSLSARVVRDPGMLGLIAVSVVIMAFYASRVGGLSTQVVVFWMVQPVLDVFLFLFARDNARSTLIPPAWRRFWQALSWGGLIFTFGDTVQTVLALVEPTAQASVPGTVQTVCFVIGTGWVAWVMLTYPTAARTFRERLRFWLDSATVLVAAAVFAWIMTVTPGLSVDDVGQVIEVLVGNALLIAAAFAAGKLVLSGNAPVTRAAATPAIAGILLQGVLTTVTPSSFDYRYFNLLLGVRLLPSVLIVIGPRLQQLQLRGDPETVTRREPKRYSKMPYVMIAGTYVMLFAAVPAGLSVRALGVLVGVVVISALVVGRQLMAFTENANLLEQLDASLVELSRTEQRFRSLVQHASDITTVVGPDTRISYISPSVLRVLGYGVEDVIGHPILSFVHPDDRDELAQQYRLLIDRPGDSVTYQGRYRHADGSWRWLDVITTNLVPEPSVGGFVSNAREVTETRELHDQLRYQASHDVLTRLANRSLFTERLAAATAGQRRDEGGAAAILLIDLDEFKAINDTLGHHVGDAVLVAVAERMRACVRAGDTAARLGGDEFAILLPGATPAAAAAVAERFLELLGEPVYAYDHLLQVRASVGVASEPADDPDALLRSADTAMYAAKRSGKGRYVRAVS